jgi:PAS domain S-box-containing protein
VKNNKQRSLLLASVSTVLIFFGSIYLPDNIHIELLYPLVVLLTISIPGNRTTFDTSVVITFLIILNFFFVNQNNDLRDKILPIGLPILFVWSFTFAIIKYKEAQLNLHKSTQYLNAMFEFATEGIIISNKSGEIILANPTAEKQLGYDSKELLGKRIEQLVPQRFTEKHPEHRAHYHSSPHSRAMGKGMNLFARKKDGSEVPVEISLSPFKIENESFVISFIIDITERHRQEQLIRKANEELEMRVATRTTQLASANESLETANYNLKLEMIERAKIEDALRNSERLYSTIAHNFPDGIICVLDEHLKIVFIDGRELEEIGVKGQELIGKSWRSMNLCAEVKEAGMDELLKKVFNWESNSVECEFTGRYYSMNAVPLPDNRGNVKEILLVIRNITRRKRAEAEMIEALNKEKTLNEMKSRFVSMASHEFRTPLSTILSSISLIDRYEGTENKEKRIKHIDRIKSSVKNLTEILNDFLSLEKLEAGKVEVNPTTFDLKMFCEEMYEEIQMIAVNGQRIDYHHTGGNTEVTTDKQLLRNILINLLNNGIKYSKENGVIEFRSNTTNGITLEVKDHGIGIPAEDQKQLFERFFRAGNVTAIQGTGLGLNIVRRYTNLLNGDISFVSEIDRGTTFTVTFPNI